MLLVRSCVFADGIFIKVAGGYQQNSSSNLQLSSQPTAGATALTVNPIRVTNRSPAFLAAIGYNWDWPRVSVSRAIVFDRTSSLWDGNPLLEDTALPQNHFNTQVSVQDILFSTQLNYWFTPQWSGFVSTGLGIAYIKTDATFYFDAPPLAAHDEAFNSLAKTVGQLGLGVEYAITPQWKIGPSLLYRYYGNINVGTFYANPPISDGTSIAIPNYHATVLLLNLTYNFNYFTARL